MKEVLCLILFLIFFLSASESKQPNIVFILADDLGFHDVGYHGSLILTPNIDQLAKGGVRLENYYVQPLCSPSRSQLLTGRYQIHTGLQHDVIFAVQRLCLPLDEVTLPEKLKQAGYKTHMVGKWHLGFYRKECLPTYRGFDSHYGYYCSDEFYYTKTVCGAWGGPWKHNMEYCGYDFHDNLKPDWSANDTYSTFLYRDRALKIINEHDQSKPLFLYLPFQAAHFPLEAPESYIQMYSHIKDVRRRIYSAMVTALDDAVGAIVDGLRKNGMMEDTVIVFSTDNGGQTVHGGNNWPLRGRKDTLWEGGVRAVGFVHGAGIQDPGRESKGLFHISDWFPTLLRIAGSNTNGTKPLDGVDVWKAIADPNSESPRKEILHNIDPIFNRIYGGDPKLKPFPNKHGINTTHGNAALRVGKWKLLVGDPGHSSWDPPPKLYLKKNLDLKCFETDCDVTEELQPSVRLFDVENDPTEKTDLTAKYPDIVDSMLARLVAYNATSVPINFPGPDEQSNPALRGGVWGPWVD